MPIVAERRNSALVVSAGSTWRVGDRADMDDKTIMRVEFHGSILTKKQTGDHPPIWTVSVS
jgi:hypothetical protein